MSRRPIGVYGLGNARVDLQVRVTEQELAQLKLRKGGMQLVDVEQQKLLLAQVRGETQIHAGGSAANTVVGLTQMGTCAAYGCSVGDDAHGLEYRRQMVAHGVMLPTAPKVGTTSGSCLILITPDAERTMNTNLAVSAELGPDDVDEETIRQAQWLYIEGYLFASPSGSEASLRAMEMARRHGTRVAVTLSDAFIVQGFRATVERAVQTLCDLVFANHVESEAYTGQSDPQAALRELRRQVPQAVVTHGAAGSYLDLGEGPVYVPAEKTVAVDLTGAGDMYAAGVLHGLVQSWSAARAGALGARAAARVVAQMGARLPGDLRDLVAP